MLVFVLQYVTDGLRGSWFVIDMGGGHYRPHGSPRVSRDFNGLSDGVCRFPASWTAHQVPECLDIYGIPGAAVGAVVLWCFQDFGHVFELFVIDDDLERLERDVAVADVFVTIDTAAAWRFGVVEVDDFHQVEPDEFVEFVEDGLGAAGGSQVIPCGEHVRGVETDGQTIRFFDTKEDVAQVLKLIAERRALAGGDFEAGEGLEAGQVVVELIERMCDAFQAGLFAVFHVRAGMRDEVGNFQRFTAQQLFTKEVQGFFEGCRVGAGEVDEVAVVADDGVEAGFFPVKVPLQDLVLGQRSGFPLALIFREDLDALHIKSAC